MLLWLIASAALIATTWHFIVPMNFRDPDDALRLVQVRDLLAGQSWFDLTQHRIFPPSGVPMHWSRLIDLPIAIMLNALKPLLGAPLAERVTLVTIPLLLLLALALVVYKIARHLSLGRGTALIAVAMLFSSLSILIQFAPMRIDHHGAQVLCGAIAVLALVRSDRHDGHLGLIAGMAMACWMQISIEGLPYAVVAGVILGLRQITRTDRWPDLRAYMISLTGVSAALLFGTHYPSDALIPWCDSFSPSYLLPLALTTATMIGARHFLPKDSLVARGVPLALAGVVGLVSFLLLSRQCLAGPFDTLDPIVYKLWYLAVMEGLPVTAQTPDLRAMIIMPSLLGLLGSLLAWHRSPDGRMREAWFSLLMMQIAAFAVSLSVMRAMSFAHVLALPGNAMLLGSLMSAAQRLTFMPLRVCLTAGTVIATPFGAASAAAAALDMPQASSKAANQVADRFRCTTYDTLRGLDALPKAILFTPLDIGAHMLVYTHHDVVATGHHRNVEGMKAVLEGLTADPDNARVIVNGTRADYVVFCRGENEIEKYRKRYPRSLIAALMAGKTPAWLVPVTMRRGESVKVYRVIKDPSA
ncbi:hypothetical protein [Sphingobium nicotianae]|uniref:hypothetical protein n=1 Tax=Sphingobium nicotianae TaxID=2782607 RepID=UPI001BE3E65B|nr:hypothetical protein [Sphingobium nicotianae]